MSSCRMPPTLTAGRGRVYSFSRSARTSAQVVVVPDGSRPQLHSVASARTMNSPRPLSEQKSNSRNRGKLVPPTAVTSPRTRWESPASLTVTVPSDRAPDRLCTIELVTSSLTISCTIPPHGCPAPSVVTTNSRATPTCSTRAGKQRATRPLFNGQTRFTRPPPLQKSLGRSTLNLVGAVTMVRVESLRLVYGAPRGSRPPHPRPARPPPDPIPARHPLRPPWGRPPHPRRSLRLPPLLERGPALRQTLGRPQGTLDRQAHGSA